MNAIQLNQANQTQDLPTVHAPTISSSALRVGLSISVPTMRKMDKRATRQVIAQNHAQTGSANVSKKAHQEHSPRGYDQASGVDPCIP
jgi:hypothetical protein